MHLCGIKVATGWAFEMTADIRNDSWVVLDVAAGY